MRAKCLILTAIVAMMALGGLGSAASAAAAKAPPPPRAIKMTSDVYLVGGSAWDGYPGLTDSGDSNAYLVDGGSELALIDFGCGRGLTALLANIQSQGFDPNRIAKVIITHAHWDHANNLDKLRAAINHPLEVVVSKADGRVLAESDSIMAAARFAPVTTEEFFGTKPDVIVANNDVVKVGERSLKVILTPGHTKGGICLLMDSVDGPVLFSGDTAIGDQNNGKGVIGWLDAHWGSNLNDFASSLKKLDKEVKASSVQFMLPGHGRPIVGAEKVQISIKNCQERLGWLRAIPQLGGMMPL